MKAESKGFIAGFSTAILCVFCILIFSFFKPGNEAPPTGTITASRAISWNEAVSLRNTFTTLAPLRIQVGQQQVPLQGFEIQASQLLEVISNNKNGGTANSVMFFFGAEAAAPGAILPTYNIIAVGVNQNGLMIPTNEQDKGDPSKSSIFDKADPCPPFCPE